MNRKNTGIELFRIILMYMICVFHVIGIGGTIDSAPTAFSHSWLMALRSLCVCAVDGYALISGYFSNGKKETNYEKIIRYWIAAFFYSFGIAMGINAIHFFTNYASYLGLANTLQSLLPVSFGGWYFRAYFAVFFLAPYIDKSLDMMEKKDCSKLFFLLLFVFSFGSMINDQWFSHGYSALWLLVLYIIGGLLKKSELFTNISKTKLFLVYLFFCFLTWLLGEAFGLESWGTYTSPTVLLSAISLLILFSKIKIGSKIVSLVSSLTFGVYLFHTDRFIRMFFIEGFFTYLNDYPFLISLLMILGIGLLIFIISAVIEYIRIAAFRFLHIDKLSKAIYARIKNILSFVSERIN